ncbi:MAG TPA: phosphate/phosphite/phosphonate ABC transporter substrate-binding protein [Myxococcota bacterium]|nr:phosphate/phosphite/phosphonate ABC transporter substrate-binding protein [Myxococcota bacterium]HQP96288.1 phosphate/phosphite/phosphonate ABC transporter substrate-binding protein [Myxococcota bacterium]
MFDKVQAPVEIAHSHALPRPVSSCRLAKLVLVALSVFLVASACTMRSPESTIATQRPATISVPRAVCLPGTAQPSIIRIGVPESISGGYRLDAPVLPELQTWLSTRVGAPVEFIPIRDYDEFTSGLANGTLAGAMIPPAEFVQARRQIPCLRLVAATVYGTSTYYGTNLIVHRDSNIKSVAGLHGTRIAFSSPRSASGYIYAADYLARHGLLPWRDYEPVFTGGHRETIQAVQNRSVDAGATFTDAIRLAGLAGVDLSDLSILAVAGEIPSEPLVVSGDLTPELARRIGTAFLEIDEGTPEERSLLGPEDLMSGWVETDDSVYTAIEDVIASVQALTAQEGTR